MATAELCPQRSKINLLIYLYEKAECLWRIGTPEHRDGDKKRETLKEIANMLEWPVSDVKKKIINLRTYFAREFARVNKSISEPGTAHMYVPQWAHYDALMFLQPYQTARKSISYLDESQESETTYLDTEVLTVYAKEEDSQDDYEQEETEESQSLMRKALSPTPSTASRVSTASHPCSALIMKDTSKTAKCKLSGLIAPKTKRTKPADELLKQAVKFFKDCHGSKLESHTVLKQHAETEDEVFVKYITMQLAKIKDERTKGIVKMRIQQVIYEGQFPQGYLPQVPNAPHTSCYPTTSQSQNSTLTNQ
ncbi:PREDICTED: uncharacterized protein LOC106812679 [Priapulus caudatus]|uniref:Uncharacterized protein LOC106812679 n=1 Tax=Priapulus caudatus TaxID=37621 RepID=A0ABM1EIS8_PRICU|nr:PREDICTED: uncharacterized protein LOC106812679 [Priapulus caudatus]